MYLCMRVCVRAGGCVCEVCIVILSVWRVSVFVFSLSVG